MAESVARKTSGSASEKKELHLIADYSDSKASFWDHVFMFVWLGWFLFYLLLPPVAYVLYYKSPALFVALFSLILISAFYPLSERMQPKWGVQIGKWMMEAATRYFSLRIYCEDYGGVLGAKPALFGLEPHDILPVGIFAFSDHLHTLPGHVVRGGLTSACFMVPGMRHVFTWGSAQSVDKKQIKKMLSKGISPCVCPGGVKEVTYMTSNANPEIVLYLKSRLGLAKLAAINGNSLIPCFAFNQRPAYKFFVPTSKILGYFGRKILGFMPLVFLGAFNIPFAPPQRTNITLVIGAPIPVPKTSEKDANYDEVVKKAQAEFVASMKRIFEEHKAKFGMKDNTLKIL